MKKGLILFYSLLMGVGSIFAEESGPKAMPVVEKFTGTWCMWCPAGLALYDMFEAELSDQVIAISYHLSDPMAISAVNNFYLRPTSVPSVFLNRDER